MDQITKHRQEIELTLKKLQEEFEKKYDHLPWARDVFSRVFPYSQKGKLIRGGLVIVGAQMKGIAVNHEVLRMAALMELIHAALLVHDDIMDDDDMRRGEASMHQQYENLALAKGSKNAQQTGRAMGICVGDSLFFIVFSLLTDIKNKHKQQMMELLSHELLTVAFGQMQDVWPESVNEETILEVYKYKTGRYSFSLPLLLGVLFAGVDKTLEKQMILFGELMGQLFQIADDYLGLYGNEEKIGKPVGSDIKEGKQTLYWYLLFKEVTEGEKKKLYSFIGKELLETEILFIKQLLTQYKINEEINVIQRRLEREVQGVVENMSVSESDKNTLLDLVRFVSQREK